MSPPPSQPAELVALDRLPAAISGPLHTPSHLLELEPTRHRACLWLTRLPDASIEPASRSQGRSRAKFSLHTFKHKQLQEGLIRYVALVGQGLELVEQRLGQTEGNGFRRRFQARE